MSDAVGAELAELAREIWAWQVDTFGDAMTVEGAVAKIRDECAEVLHAERAVDFVRRQQWGSRLMLSAALTEPIATRREELADVFFMLVQLDGAGNPSRRMMPGLSDGIGHLHEQGRHRAECLAGLLGETASLSAAAYQVWLTGDEGRFRSVVLRNLWCEFLECAVIAWGDACNANSDLPHMSAAIRAKLAENKTRRWAKPAEDGTISHVKGHDDE